MNLIETIAALAGNIFTDRRLFARKVKYVRKNGHEVEMDATSYKTDENSMARAGAALDIKIKEFLVKTESLKINGTRFLPAQDDKIYVGQSVFRVANGENQKPYRYIDATETMMVIQTQRFGKNVSS